MGNEFLNLKWMDNIPISDCCGTPTIHTDYGICPDCKEHCEFIYPEYEEEKSPKIISPTK